MNFMTEMRAKARQAYEANLQKVETLLPIYDAAVKAAKYWEELTGEKIILSRLYYDQIVITVHMGHLMPNGCYPSKHTHLSYLREFIDEALEGLISFDDFKVHHDVTSTDMTWGKPYGGPQLKVFAYHGGNCTYKQVGTKTVEQPVYEMECN